MQKLKWLNGIPLNSQIKSDWYFVSAHFDLFVQPAGTAWTNYIFLGFRILQIFTKYDKMHRQPNPSAFIVNAISCGRARPLFIHIRYEKHSASAYHTLAPDTNFCCSVLACMMHLSISCTMVLNYPVIFVCISLSVLKTKQQKNKRINKRKWSEKELEIEEHPNEWKRRTNLVFWMRYILYVI